MILMALQQLQESKSFGPGLMTTELYTVKTVITLPTVVRTLDGMGDMILDWDMVELDAASYIP
jgi:hypothetical protein